ncbi:HpcH/HpaI aldolase/citrate lyase family protein [Rhizomicrobium electricum]|uniref:CoA ester lyase n=1 Tax=Rhizomicrobium electricum TaxID=480070 RepID=A0ABN1ELP0_9PROT|nr:CoA ester lyase [Rhizomicrobium electricum]NIJ47030.1 citrate lyase subunit beta/citryl-CoA lyase [Rhizomicrobium electricum]
MRLRSLLFVPGDRPDRFPKAFASGADAVIIDLEDSVALAAKERARSNALAALQSRGDAKVFIRINSLASALVEADLNVVMPGRPDGVVLPKAEGVRSLAGLDELLAAAERQYEIAPGATRVLPIVTETPAALFKLGEYGGPRLCAMTWGAEDLPAAIGAATSREEDGRYTPPFEMVRSLALFAAAAAGVVAIETVYPKFTDGEGLAAYAARGARDGFSGMLAIHPAQIGPINAAFTPSPEQIARAKAVVQAFAAGAGVIALDGVMLDAPHLVQAQRVLARVGDPT